MSTRFGPDDYQEYLFSESYGLKKGQEMYSFILIRTEEEMVEIEKQQAETLAGATEAAKDSTEGTEGAATEGGEGSTEGVEGAATEGATTETPAA